MGTDLHVGHVVMAGLLHDHQLQTLHNLTHRLAQQHQEHPGGLTLLLLGHICGQYIIQACQEKKWGGNYQ